MMTRLVRFSANTTAKADKFKGQDDTRGLALNHRSVANRVTGGLRYREIG